MYMLILILIYNTLESQNIMNTYLILFGTPLTRKTAVNLHWHGCHKSSVDDQQIEPDIQAVLAPIWDIQFFMHIELLFFDTSDLLYQIKIW